MGFRWHSWATKTKIIHKLIRSHRKHQFRESLENKILALFLIEDLIIQALNIFHGFLYNCDNLKYDYFYCKTQYVGNVI